MGSISLQGRNILMLTEKKMLLVDGDDGIRKSLSSFFEARKCHLHTVENATEALIAIKKEPYDIILCEELLPDMNGLVFFKKINSRCYWAIKILISLYGNNTTFEDIREKGIDYLLTKPFSGDEVEAVVVRLVKERCSNNGQNCTERQSTSK